MSVYSSIEHIYIRLVDAIFARLPQPRPSTARLKGSKIISHRGEHDGVHVKENTMPAFEQALAGGLWGIEFDVRWTKDLIPVVVHDADLYRVFGINEQVEGLSFSRLRQMAPAVPALSEVARRFGGRLHLMIEIKDNHWPDPSWQSKTLMEALYPLVPVADFHLMALKPDVFGRISGFPAASLLAIANHHPANHSRTVIENHWGGVCAHYSLTRRSVIEKMHQRHGKFGTGYPASRNVLFREINRGADFIFSNNACELMAILRKELALSGE